MLTVYRTFQWAFSPRTIRKSKKRLHCCLGLNCWCQADEQRVIPSGQDSSIFQTPCLLRADVCKYQPEACNSEKLKILKKIHNIAHGKLLQEMHVLLWSDNYFWWEAMILNSPLLNRVFGVWHHTLRRPCFKNQTSFVPNEKHPVW